MAGNYTRYPNPSISANPSVGSNGAAIPTSSTLFGGSDGTDLIPLQVDGAGVLSVNVTAIDPSAGLATEAKQDSQILIETDIETNTQKVADAVQEPFTAYNFTQVMAVGGIDQNSISQDLVPLSLNNTDLLVRDERLRDSTQSPAGAVPTFAVMAGGSDGTNTRFLKTDSSGELQVDVISSALPSGAATAAIQTDGTQKTQIVDAAGDVTDVKALSSVPVSTDKGLITQSIIHGLNSSGGGTYVDVKVNPAGKLLVTADIDQTTPGTTNGVVVTTALPSGTNNIGDVDVLSLPSIPAGTNNIGDVDVLTLPAIPAGTNTIGYVLAAPPSGSTNATTRSASTALEASRVIKASSGRLQCITATTNRTSDQYLQIFNSTTVPADGTAPVYVYKLPADSTIVIDVSPIGVYFSTGISISNSTTLATKTIGSADCYFTVEYV